jgi:hypothetical protein
MTDKQRVATRYAPKTANADKGQNEEYLQIIKELLNMKDAQLTDDERANSTDLTDFDFTI